MSKKFFDFDGIFGDLNLNPAIETEKNRLFSLCGNSKIKEL